MEVEANEDVEKEVESNESIEIPKEKEVIIDLVMNFLN